MGANGTGSKFILLKSKSPSRPQFLTASRSEESYTGQGQVCRVRFGVVPWYEVEGRGEVRTSGVHCKDSGVSDSLLCRITSTEYLSQRGTRKPPVPVNTFHKHCPVLLPVLHSVVLHGQPLTVMKMILEVHCLDGVTGIGIYNVSFRREGGCRSFS